MPDHVHALVTYPPNLSHSDMLMNLKSRSSKRIHETFPSMSRFAWQDGYAGFTVSRSVVPAVKAYIEGQKEHHKTQDFKTEFLELLRRHGVEFDENELSGGLLAEPRRAPGYTSCALRAKTDP